MNARPLFRKVLIANRGEIALRVLSCLKKLDIPSVAIYHRDDRHAPFVRQADERVEVTGESPTAAYLDIDQIVDTCKRLEVDAVHPSYGFLSENAGFARSLTDAGIRFIGPTPDAIILMGDKIRSREFADNAGVPVSPSVTIDPDNPEFEQAVSDLKLPLVVKASAGGGGKGMSIVSSMDELKSSMKLAASEAEKYFGNRQIYIERYFENARHIEVQILSDGDNVIHLGERECSIQRRFQKIIEESPSPALNEDERDAICQAAVRLARAANYINAGTVEFLFTPEREFYFLEMNTRIQVEHPVTEMVTGIDLVEQQIRIASGEQLKIKQDDVTLSGHAMECRICSEDADHDFMPQTGKIHYLREPSGDGVRFDSGLYSGQTITTAFDPMLAKLIVHAGNRTDAISKARRVLEETVVLGVETNINYLDRILAHPVFEQGGAHTGFLKAHRNDLADGAVNEGLIQAILAAAMLTDRSSQTLMHETPEPYRAIGRWQN